MKALYGVFQTAGSGAEREELNHPAARQCVMAHQHSESFDYPLAESSTFRDGTSFAAPSPALNQTLQEVN